MKLPSLSVRLAYLGGAIADGLAKAGAQVVVCGRNETNGEARAEAIREAGGKAIYVRCDASDKTSLEACQETVIEKVGAPTVL